MQDRCFCRFEGLMGNQTHTMGIGHQCIARNSGLALISLGEATIDNEQLAITLDR